jgi:hypothetical protein
MDLSLRAEGYRASDRRPSALQLALRLVSHVRFRRPFFENLKKRTSLARE